MVVLWCSMMAAYSFHQEWVYDKLLFQLLIKWLEMHISRCVVHYGSSIIFTIRMWYWGLG